MRGVQDGNFRKYASLLVESFGTTSLRGGLKSPLTDRFNGVFFFMSLDSSEVRRPIPSVCRMLVDSARLRYLELADIGIPTFECIVVLYDCPECLIETSCFGAL